MVVVLALASGAGLAVSRVVNSLAKGREDQGSSPAFVAVTTVSTLLIVAVLLWGLFTSTGTAD